MQDALREYIESRCLQLPVVGCWLWLASFGSHGYGNARHSNGQNTTAHRVSFEAFWWPIPDGALVQHSCDNKWCVNPDHLSLGTDKTNSDDKHRKGRSNLMGRRFSPHPTRKLTDAQVVAIRRVNEPHQRTARRFGVDAAVIQRIRRGRHYRDVSDDIEPDPLPLLPEQVELVERLFREAEAENDSELLKDAI